MTTMVENKKSSGQHPEEPSREVDDGFGSAAVRFDKVEADMRAGFARIDENINGLRGEMTALGNGLRSEMNTRLLALGKDFRSFQRTMIGVIVVALIINKIF